MTISERNAMKDRERIKQFIESTMRRCCDDILDGEDIPKEVFEMAFKQLVDLSIIYKNMGLDKESEK